MRPLAIDIRAFSLKFKLYFVMLRQMNLRGGKVSIYIYKMQMMKVCLLVKIILVKGRLDMLM